MTVDGQQGLVTGQGIVGDGDDRHLRVLARQLVRQKRGAHVAHIVLEPQQARSEARRQIGQQQRGSARRSRQHQRPAQGRRGGLGRTLALQMGLQPHAKHPIC